MDAETLAVLERLTVALERQVSLAEEGQKDYRAAKREGVERYDKSRRDQKRHADAQLAEAQATRALLAAQAQRNIEFDARAERAEARAVEQWEWAKLMSGITAPDDASALVRVPDDEQET
jgi:hypothetical protein